MLGKKIYHYAPGCSDDEDDGTELESISHDDPEAIDTPASPRPIKSWNSWSEIFDDPDFEIVNEDDRMVYATALCPPPWHRPKERMLVYEPAGPDDE